MEATASTPEPKGKQGKSNKLRMRLGCALVVLVVLLSCVVLVALLWLGGYVQKFSCQTVVQGSTIWNSLNCGQNSNNAQFKYYQSDSSATTTPSSSDDLVTKVFDKASPSVVGIGIKGDATNPDSIIGTGFIITENGLILTNRHVVADETQTYFVNLKDSTEAIAVTQIYRDPVNDIAIVKIDKTNLPFLPLGDSDNLKQGQTAIAIGNPLGKYSGTVTSGIISGLKREVQVSQGFFNGSVNTYENVIQTDAAINPGNSGGPLLNSAGEVVGINFATVQGAENLSFAVPINEAKSRIEELNQYGKFRIPFVGVQYRLTFTFVNGQDTVGAQVISVVKGSPAEQGGLQAGDIITDFNGTSVQDKDLSNLIQTSKIGDQVTLGVLRAGKSYQIKITIGEQ